MQHVTMVFCFIVVCEIALNTNTLNSKDTATAMFAKIGWC
jgi:hypothetical protein